MKYDYIREIASPTISEFLVGSRWDGNGYIGSNFEVKLFQYPLNNVLKSVEVDLRPKGSQFAFTDLAVSPDGKRFAVMAICDNTAFWQRIRFLKRFAARSIEEEIWVYEFETKKFYKICTVPMTGNRNVPNYWLSWMPDSKRITFESEGELYVVNAD